VAAPTGAAIVAEFRRFVGDPYVYGDAGPAAFDCSGLVQYVLGKLGISAPRTSEAQWAWVQKVSRSQLQAGDLVFMQFPGDNASPGHVEVYIGGGQVLGADDPAQGVAITSLASNLPNVVGYGRVPNSAVSTASSGGGGLLSLPSDVLGLFDQATSFATKLLWILNPENWARIIAGLFAAFLLIAGLGFLIAAGI
jgi:hypothetical protein